MSDVVRKEVCECINCGNEAEMIVTCTLKSESDESPKVSASPSEKATEPKMREKGQITCKHCGSEADMWLD